VGVVSDVPGRELFTVSYKNTLLNNYSMLPMTEFVKHVKNARHWSDCSG